MKYMGMLLLLSLAVPVLVHAEDPSKKVLECMRANVPQTTRTQEIELVATDHVGTIRTFKGKLFAKRQKVSASETLMQATLRIDSPASVAGASYLIREKVGAFSEGVYVYLPAIKRVRRISADFSDGALLGTNFSYNDLKQLAYAFNGATAQMEADQEIDRRPTHVLTFKAGSVDGSRYSVVRTWVDKKSCVPLKALFFDGDTPVKEFTAQPAALQQSGGYWYASEVEMRNLEEGTSSVMRFTNVKSNGQLPSRIFDPALFYLSN